MCTLQGTVCYLLVKLSTYYKKYILTRYITLLVLVKKQIAMFCPGQILGDRRFSAGGPEIYLRGGGEEERAVVEEEENQGEEKEKVFLGVLRKRISIDSVCDGECVIFKKDHKK